MQRTPPGLPPPGGSKVRGERATHKVHHDKVVVGVAAAAPAGAFRVQAALERGPRPWGVRRVHLVQDKAEEGFCALGQVLFTVEGSVRDPTLAASPSASGHG